MKQVIPPPLAPRFRKMIQKDVTMKLLGAIIAVVASGAGVAFVMAGENSSQIGGELIIVFFVAIGGAVVSLNQLLRERRSWVDVLKSFERFGKPEELARQVEAELDGSLIINEVLITTHWLIDLTNASYGRMIHVPSLKQIIAGPKLIKLSDDHHNFFLPVDFDENGNPYILSIIQPTIQPRIVNEEEWDLMHMGKRPTRSELIISSKKKSLWINVGCSTIVIGFILWILIAMMMG